MKRQTTIQAFDLIVIGGGAAGMFSAATAASFGLKVLLIEKNQKCGKKLRITGKGRCNVTNNCTPAEAMRNIPTNGRFLYSAFSKFSPQDTMEYFEKLGVPLKTERGQRVFPVSDKAEDVVEALRQELQNLHVKVIRDTAEQILVNEGQVYGVKTAQKKYFAKQIILATGGLSYPATGSTGDGYRMAGELGHTVMPCSGSLVPLSIIGTECGRMAGLSLRNVGVKLYGNKKKPIYEDFGEALFMNYGLSGPIILSSSAHMNEKNGPYALVFDLKPALTEQQLDARLLRDFQQRSNDMISDGLRGVLPAQMVSVILNRANIPMNRPVRDITKEERRAIITEMKALRFEVEDKRPVEEAIITHGGVKISEINPSTMESKIVSGLYFAGEIIDCDAYTGGFNLQIAWATAYTAATSCRNSD